MKKRTLSTLALLGMASALTTFCQTSADASQPAQANKNSSKEADNNKDADSSDNDGNLGYHLYTEDELMLELNDKGIALYKSLSPEGKALALKVASQRCNGTNECKGLNACATDKNKCAGKGACKGQSKCAFSDKNLAVKVVVDKMASKRANANQGK